MYEPVSYNHQTGFYGIFDQGTRMLKKDRDSENMPDEAQEVRRPMRISISDGFVLAALPVFAYIFHYFFEFGYLSYFDIPAAFISFNLSEMIPAVFIIALIYYILVVILWPYVSYFLAVVPGFIKTILILFPWLIIFILLRFSWDIILFLLLIILLVFGADKIRDFYRRRITGKGTPPDLNTVKEKAHNNLPVETNSAFEQVVAQVIPRGNRYVLFYILFFALVSSIALGRAVAVTRTAYPIADASPGCAVVYITSDRYICKPFLNGEFENTFTVFHFKDSQNIVFHYENVGPLRPKPTNR